MLIQTRAIVFKKIKYNDNSIIAQLYTEKVGIQSYLVQGIHKKKSNAGAAFFQPLSLLEIVAYSSEKEGLKRLKEAKFYFPYQDIYQNMIKGGILMFINEMLNKSIKEEETNPQLFRFIEESLILLDKTDEKIIDFHLLFLIKLSAYLGFRAAAERLQNAAYFDLQEGIYTPFKPVHKNYTADEITDFWQQLQHCTWDELPALKFSNEQRNHLLQTIIDYYKLHLHGFGELKSLEVLKSIWH